MQTVVGSDSLQRLQLGNSLLHFCKFLIKIVRTHSGMKTHRSFLPES